MYGSGNVIKTSRGFECKGKVRDAKNDEHRSLKTDYHVEANRIKVALRSAFGQVH